MRSSTEQEMVYPDTNGLVQNRGAGACRVKNENAKVRLHFRKLASQACELHFSRFARYVLVAQWWGSSCMTGTGWKFCGTRWRFGLPSAEGELGLVCLFRCCMLERLLMLGLI